VEATPPVTVFVAVEDEVPDEPELFDEPLDVLPLDALLDVPPLVVLLERTEPLDWPDTIEVGALVEAWEASYPNSSTTTDTVLSSQNVMRFMRSPR
jgi:hypothetical protein